ncbi:MAG: hypothetical protein HDS79_01520 [Bacteroidales bacterium]|nr:hypothetical protein [Bacteroidales bacterium]
MRPRRHSRRGLNPFQGLHTDELRADRKAAPEGIEAANARQREARRCASPGGD